MTGAGTCPCCGHPALEDAAVKEDLTPMQRRLYDVLKSVGQAGIGISGLMDRVYSNGGYHTNGPPNSPNVLHVQKRFMKERLAKHGLRITSSRGPGALWRLESAA